MKRYVILEDDEGSFRELLEMTGQQQRTAPREEAPPPKEQGLKALVRGLKDEAEMEAIADALEKTNWCRKDAARMLGISYKALLYKMRQFNLDSGRGSRSAAAKEAAKVAAAAKEAAAKSEEPKEAVRKWLPPVRAFAFPSLVPCRILGARTGCASAQIRPNRVRRT